MVSESAPATDEKKNPSTFFLLGVWWIFVFFLGRPNKKKKENRELHRSIMSEQTSENYYNTSLKKFFIFFGVISFSSFNSWLSIRPISSLNMNKFNVFDFSFWTDATYKKKLLKNFSFILSVWPTKNLRA